MVCRKSEPRDGGVGSFPLFSSFLLDFSKESKGSETSHTPIKVPPPYTSTGISSAPSELPFPRGLSFFFSFRVCVLAA